MNILIGQNNSGKSNVLRFLMRQYRLCANDSDELSKQSDLDQPKSRGNPTVTLGVKVKKTDAILDRVLESRSQLKTDLGRRQRIKSLLYSDTDSIWFYLQREHREKRFSITKWCVEQLINQLNFNKEQTYEFFRILTNASGGDLDIWRQTITEQLSPFHILNRNVDLIPAVRTVRTYQHSGLRRDEQKGYFFDGIRDHSGIGLTEELFVLQNPVYGAEAQQTRFAKINQFVRDVTGNASAKIEIPHDRSMIIVEMDGRRLPLESLGSGIEEVTIIAAKATMFQDQIVCIEEPELHLHPALQKKLIRFLHYQTNNQYFVTSHSAHLLDAVPCSVLHVRLQDGFSQISHAATSAAKFEVCRDLGCRASDIIQANCIVWVEGPTERIYLNHWLRACAPELVEGLHYSIMFYGGRLLSHLSADDADVREFISLRALNRNMSIIIDSDRSQKGTPLNKTKLRVKAEFEKSREGIVWITKGREIENYVTEELLYEAIRSTHKDAFRLPAYGQYQDLTTYKRKGSAQVRDIDKLRVAHYVASKPANLKCLDLADRVGEIANFIRSVNETAV